MALTSSLKSLRNTVMGRADWTPNAGPDAITFVDESINGVVQQLAIDAPNLFFESTVRFATMPDEEATVENDRIVMLEEDGTDVTNPWLFLVQVLPGSEPGLVEWKTDRSWDGRYIDIIDGDGVVHQNRIRSVFEVASGGAISLTVWHPWDWQTHGIGPFKYRVYTPEYPIPDDMIELAAIRAVGRPHYRPITVISQVEAEELGYDDWSNDVAAASSLVAFRRGHFAMPSPNTAPTVVLTDGEDSDETWLGPEPVGEFEYCFTLSWGKRDMDYASPGPGFWNDAGDNWEETDTQGSGRLNWSKNRKREPMWESAPSPISDAITVPSPGESTFPCVKLTVPNIEYMLGFMLEGSTGAGVDFRRLSSGHSGWHYRIYRRRKSENFTGYTRFGTTIPGTSALGLTKLDIQDAFYLLQELRIEGENGGVILDRGDIIPDYNRRLRSVAGYQSIRLYPQPDTRQEIEIRCTRKPDILVSENDTPPIHAEAIKIIVEGALVPVFQKLGRPQDAMTAEAKYEKLLQGMRSSYGDARPEGVPLYKKPARIRRTRGTNISWYKGG